MTVTRRHFLKSAAAISLGFTGLQRNIAVAAGAEGIGAGYGPLLPDAGGILDLPEGFSYRVLSRTGDAMSDGLLVPGLPDAMAAFAGPQGRTLLVCNHELMKLCYGQAPTASITGVLSAGRFIAYLPSLFRAAITSGSDRR